MNTLPAPFEERMKMLLADEAEAFFRALQTESPVSIRLNPGKIYPVDKIFPQQTFRPVEWCKEACYLSQRPVFTLDPGLHGGAYYVQEASSMFLHHILRQIMPDKPLRVLDLCAAPGGKSTLIASALPQDSLLVANEVIRTRASVLKENIIKWGHSNIIVTNNDPADFSSLEGTFDIILVDAPCSGEGLFRKDPEAIREWTPNNLRLCCERQQRILTDIWKCLKPEGHLIYSTCTYNTGENENILEWLTHEFNSTPIHIEHTFESITPGYSEQPCYRFYPHKTIGEGFFIGVVQKQDGELFTLRKNKKQNNQKPAKLSAELQPFVTQPERYSVYDINNTTGIIPTRHTDFIQWLNARLRVIYQGCELAETDNRKLKLLPGLALWQGLNRAHCNICPTDRNTALTYLKKEDIPVPQLPVDWLLIVYQGIGLGWCKNLGNRLNNYYPKEWRIRMQITETKFSDEK